MDRAEWAILRVGPQNDPRAAGFGGRGAGEDGASDDRHPGEGRGEEERGKG